MTVTPELVLPRPFGVMQNIYAYGGGSWAAA